MTDILDTDADEITQLRADLMGERDAYGLLLIRCEQAEAENARLRARISDDRLYLASCVAHLSDMAGTPWHDGLKRLAEKEPTP